MTTRETKHTPELLASLRFYETRANHGRGRLTGSTAKLRKAGYIQVAATGFYTWCATITAAGRAALEKARQ